MLPLLLTVSVLASGCLSADVVDTLVNTPKASTLAQLVGKAGLAGALKGSGPFTIFAPTDTAFSKVDSATLSDLLTHPDKLAAVLKGHVLSGEVLASSLRNEEIATTLQGDKIRINIYSHNKVNTVNGVKISETDLKADNGVIHFVDDVIMPASVTIRDIIARDPDLSKLNDLIKAAGIEREFLFNPETVFAPTNAAIDALRSSDLSKLGGDQKRLKETLEYHAIPHTLFSKGLYNNEYPKSSDSHEDRLHIRVGSSGVSINNAKVIEADKLATNGVVHKIDHVLIPIRVGFWLRTGIGRR